MIIISIIGLLCSLLIMSYIIEEKFVHSLEVISDKLKMTKEMAGATFMAIGSSAPEIFVALFSVLKPGEHQEIGIGSIIGSALFNLLFIVGAVAAVKNTKLTWQPVLRDLIFYIISVLLLIFVIKDGNIDLYDSIILLFVYFIYIIAVVKWKVLFPYKETSIEQKQTEEKNFVSNINNKIDKVFKYVFPKKDKVYITFFISIILIAFVSWIMVESAVVISEKIGIPKIIIGLTVLAIGTSIPDLMSSIIVAKKGNGDMGVSNAIGSNVFDILVGLGLPYIVYILLNDSNVIISTDNIILSIIVLFSSIILIFLIFIANKWKVNKTSGYILIISYLLYLIYEIYNVF